MCIMLSHYQLTVYNPSSSILPYLETDAFFVYKFTRYKSTMPPHHCTAMRNRVSVRLSENTAEPNHPKIQGFPQDALNEQLNSSLFTHLDAPSLILRQSKQFCTFLSITRQKVFP